MGGAASAVGSTAPVTDPPRVALAIAPNTATPTALPIDRKNRLFAVTTPRSVQPTLLCAAIRVGLATRPMPRPTTKQQPATSTPSTPRRAAWSGRRRQITSTLPISAVLRNPSRR